MRYITAVLVTISTSLWLGGLVTLAAMVMAVFIKSGLDRETAGRATSVMFIWFGWGQLGVAGLALVGVFLGYVQRRGAVPVALFVLLAGAAVGAAYFSAYLVPHIESLRRDGQSTSADFQGLHKQSERLMSAMTGVVFIATLLLPAFCRAMIGAAKVKPADSLAD